SLSFFGFNTFDCSGGLAVLRFFVTHPDAKLIQRTQSSVYCMLYNRYVR
ncbi:unnamed protein product, partial [Ascophyllum nodosum]